MNFGDARLPDRFWSKCIPEPNSGCWLWFGARARGYGYIQIKLAFRVYKATLAHRHAYETLVGPIETGLDLDHLCRNTACCSPRHLEPVTHIENLRRSPLGFYNGDTQRELARRPRSIRRGATHCKRGHAFEGDNLRISSNGTRLCRMCVRIEDKFRRNQEAQVHQ